MNDKGNTLVTIFMPQSLLKVPQMR